MQNEEMANDLLEAIDVENAPYRIDYKKVHQRPTRNAIRSDR